MTNTDYLRHLLGMAEQKYGPNAPATQDLRKQLRKAEEGANKPPMEQRYLVGFRENNIAP